MSCLTRDTLRGNILLICFFLCRRARQVNRSRREINNRRKRTEREKANKTRQTQKENKHPNRRNILLIWCPVVDMILREDNEGSTLENGHRVFDWNISKSCLHEVGKVLMRNLVVKVETFCSLGIILGTVRSYLSDNVAKHPSLANALCASFSFQPWIGELSRVILRFVHLKCFELPLSRSPCSMIKSHPRSCSSSVWVAGPFAPLLFF